MYIEGHVKKNHPYSLSGILCIKAVIFQPFQQYISYFSLQKVEN